MTRTAIKRASLEAMYARKPFAEPQPDQDPDGQYWIDSVKIEAQQFISLAGRETYDRWCDVILPGNSGIHMTWQDTYRRIHAAVDLMWRRNNWTFDELIEAVELTTWAYERGLTPVDLADYRDLLHIKDEEMRTWR